MTRSLRRILVLAVALTAAAPSAATATVRFMSPNGAKSGSCVQASPCHYTYVVNGAGSQAGDTILVKVGTYDVGSTPMTLSHRLTLARAPGLGGRPIIRTDLDNVHALRVNPGAGGSSISDLRIDAPSDLNGNGISLVDDATLDNLDVRCGYRCIVQSNGHVTLEDSKVALTGNGYAALSLDTGADVRRTDVTVKGNGNAAVIRGPGSTLVDSTVSSDSGGISMSGGTAGAPQLVDRVRLSAGYGLATAGTALVRNSLLVSTAPQGVALTSSSGASKARNVTAVALGAQGIGVRAGIPDLTSGASLEARNVIARGAGTDVTGTAFSNNGINCPCPASSLDIASSQFTTTGPEVTAHGKNVSDPPSFVDLVGGDFGLAPGSAAIDAGEADALIGATDLAGHQRTQGSAPDLGAYESTPVPVPATGTGTPGGSGAGAPPITGSAPGDHTSPVLSAVAVSRTRVLSFRLSEAASAKIVVSRRVRGRGRTTRLVKLGTLTRSARNGRNLVRLPRRIGRTTLRAGTLYVLTVTAADRAGNRSRTVSRNLSPRP